MSTCQFSGDECSATRPASLERPRSWRRTHFLRFAGEGASASCNQPADFAKLASEESFAQSCQPRPSALDGVLAVSARSLPARDNRGLELYQYADRPDGPLTGKVVHSRCYLVLAVGFDSLSNQRHRI